MDALESNIAANYQTNLGTSEPSNLQLAINDIKDGLIYKSRLWSHLGVAEIRRRYKRTMIGPFWTTLSLGLFISSMGFILSSAWHTTAQDFLPYFCSGYICWMLLQSILAEGCNTFTSPGTFVKQISLPYTIYACLITWRNVLILLHHLIILALVLWYAHVPINANFLYFIPGLTLVFLTSVWVSTLLGMACARFRDVQQVVTSVLQLAMFITPVMWRPEQLGIKGMLVADLNPLFHFISIIRLPLIGQAPSLNNWIWSISCFVIGTAFTTFVLSKNYRKLVYWI